MILRVGLHSYAKRRGRIPNLCFFKKNRVNEKFWVPIVPDTRLENKTVERRENHHRRALRKSHAKLLDYQLHPPQSSLLGSNLVFHRFSDFGFLRVPSRLTRQRTLLVL